MMVSVVITRLFLIMILSMMVCQEVVASASEDLLRASSDDSRIDYDESRIVSVRKQGDDELYRVFETDFIAWDLGNNGHSLLVGEVYEVPKDHWDQGTIDRLVLATEALTEIDSGASDTE